MSQVDVTTKDGLSYRVSYEVGSTEHRGLAVGLAVGWGAGWQPKKLRTQGAPRSGSEVGRGKVSQEGKQGFELVIRGPEI